MQWISEIMMFALAIVAISLQQKSAVSPRRVPDYKISRSARYPDPIERLIIPDLVRVGQFLKTKYPKIPAFTTRNGLQGLPENLNAFGRSKWWKLPGITSSNAFMKSKLSFEYRVYNPVANKAWSCLNGGTPFLLAFSNDGTCLAVINAAGKPLSEEVVRRLAL